MSIDELKEEATAYFITDGTGLEPIEEITDDAELIREVERCNPFIARLATFETVRITRAAANTIIAEYRHVKALADQKQVETAPADEIKPLEPITKSRARRTTTNVYFIQGVNGGLVKIGSAVCVESRRKGLQCGSADVLKVVKIIPDVSPQLERDLHGRFHQYRQHGEWFSPEVLDLEIEL